MPAAFRRDVSASGVLELEPLFHLVMVINHFNISWSLFSPLEADSVLIIDSDAELAFSLTPFHWLQAISRRHPEIIELFSRIKVIQSLACYLPQFVRKCFSRCFGAPSIEQIFGGSIAKGDNHWKHDSTDIMLFQG